MNISRNGPFIHSTWTLCVRNCPKWMSLNANVISGRDRHRLQMFDVYFVCQQTHQTIINGTMKPQDAPFLTFYQKWYRKACVCALHCIALRQSWDGEIHWKWSLLNQRARNRLKCWFCAQVQPITNIHVKCLSNNRAFFYSTSIYLFILKFGLASQGAMFVPVHFTVHTVGYFMRAHFFFLTSQQRRINSFVGQKQRNNRIFY